MRFIAEGPSIPNELLDLRNNGEVVFFCGAGVSKPAGLPGFFELTKKLMKDLGVAGDAQSMRLMASSLDADDPSLAPPLDQVFSWLQRDYTDQHIHNAVTKLLRTPPQVSSKSHETILKLSRSAADEPFVVTTNFDLLFERAARKIPYWSYPSLPNLHADALHTGVVYLHGRLSRSSDNRRNPLLLSSRDLGRAYLADGWATTFVRQLMERKVIVFLGYSAGDPPIRYLLEGLGDSSSLRPRPIFAFDWGTHSEVRARWEPLGVEGIPFQTFEGLWDTLEAWSIQAASNDKWVQSVLKLSRRQPETLEPFQRGQVAALVSTVAGATKFANAEPPPPAEWLCVFDRHRRFSAAEKISWDRDADTFDPLEAYGLDDDPPRPPENQLRIQNVGVDLLETLPTELDGLGHGRLAGTIDPRQGPSARLAALSHWFERVSHEPAAIWWAAKQSDLHSSLRWVVSRRLSGHGGEYQKEVRALWTKLLELDRSDRPFDIGWYDFVGKVKRDGWCASTLRALERRVRPGLGLSEFHRSPRPPTGPVDESLLTFEVVVPDRYDPLPEVPDHSIADVLAILRQSLIRAAGLMTETVYSNSALFKLPAIDPDDRPGERFVRNKDILGNFLWFVALFRRLAAFDRIAARQEFRTWPDDKYFFERLRIFSWSLDGLFEPAEVVDGLLALTDEAFSKGDNQRELLHLLRSVAGRLTRARQLKIEVRLRRGRTRYHRETASDFRARKLHLVGTRLGWLQRHGWRLGEVSLRKLGEFRSTEGWEERWELNADNDLDGRSGWVRRETDPGNLIESPLGLIVQNAIRGSARELDNFVENVPFAGLVGRRPARALAALAYESRRGEYPEALWQELLSSWPDDAPVRLSLLCASRIARLPAKVAFQLRHSTTSWLEKHLPTVWKVHPAAALAVWDDAYAALVAGGPKATESGIGETTVGGVVQKESRKTIDYAINAPVGHLVDCLFDMLPRKKRWIRGEGLPVYFTDRLSRSLTAPGEGSDHAATLIGRQLGWLYHCDPIGIGEELVRMAQPGQPQFEALWSGVIAAGSLPQSPELFAKIKEAFLSLFAAEDLIWSSSLRQTMGELLTVGAYWFRKDAAYISPGEARTALQKTSTTTRQSSLWMLSTIVAKYKAWRSFGKLFLEEVWPKEAMYRSSEITNAMLQVAEADHRNFPDIVATILPYLTAVEYPDLFMYRELRQPEDGGSKSLAQRWPLEVLALANVLVAENVRTAPYRMAELLDAIAVANPVARETRSWQRLNALLNRA